MATKSSPEAQASLLTEREVARLLNVATKTLQKWRRQGKGPKFLKLSRCVVRYDLGSVQSYLESCHRASTADPGVVR